MFVLYKLDNSVPGDTYERYQRVHKSDRHLQVERKRRVGQHIASTKHFVCNCSENKTN